MKSNMRQPALLVRSCRASRWTAYVVALAGLLATNDSAHAQAFIEHLATPVLQRGAVNRLELLGTEADGAIGLWTSLPDGTCRAQPVDNAGRPGAAFNVELTAAAPLGLYGLRLATRSGLSNVHLFLVDELPVTHRDPTLADDAVVPTKLPACITALCRPALVDRYAITVEAGQRVAFEVVGNRLGKDYDPLVRILDASGSMLAECDNSVGLFFDCRFAHTFAQAGTYIVELSDARYEGNATWHYVLRMGDFPDARVAIPSAVLPGATTLSFPQAPGWQLPVTIAATQPLGELYHEIRTAPNTVATWVALAVSDLPPQVEAEPNDKSETATPVTVPSTLNGVLGQPGDSDWFAFDLTQGQKLNFQGIARKLGSAADLELVLYDADAREVRRVDDVLLDEGGFSFVTGKPGVHRLQVRDLARDGGPAFAYRIEVRTGGLQIQLQAETADLTIPQGNYQTLPLKITRTEFPGEIELELRGAPAGVTLEPTVIPAAATEFVARIIAGAGTPEGLYSLQLVAKATVEVPAPKAEAGKPEPPKPEPIRLEALVSAQPLVDRQLKNVDLIPYALREDQRHLPPSVSNRLALMITPPSPFTAEVPTELLKLTRYQTADFPIVTTRVPGLTSPITFTVKGGQIGLEKEERNQVYARFQPATPEQPQGVGTFYNRILTNLAKHRVDLTATTEMDGRRINLTRTFTLDIQSAFQPTYDPPEPTTEPGKPVKFRILANRVPTFDGPLTFTLGPFNGFKFPETVELPKGQEFVEVEVQPNPTLNIGKHGLRIQVAGFVGKYEESINLPNINIDVKKPPTP